MAGNDTDGGVQVLRVLDNHLYELDEDNLREILLRPDVQDCPVAVVSVAGAYRTGKSFLLDFFLRYCKASPSDRQNNTWLGSEDETLEGFKWKGGSEKATNGIQLWPEPIPMILPSGKKVMVLLMDTQGTFDTSSTIKDCSTIFALSTLLSSVQIYNIVGNIKEDDLQHLQLFTRYGIMAKDDEETPFQVLQFLVRDWMSPYEHTYGIAGGNNLLKKRLEVHDNQHPDLRTLREQIRSCFETVTCFLMPHPGFCVTNPSFKGRLADLELEFKENLKALVPAIFKEYLAPRIINGAEIKGRDLFDYFKTYTSIFSGNDLPEPVTILQATSSVTLMRACRDANEVYEKYMDENCGTNSLSTSAVALKDVHLEAIQAAEQAFKAKKQMNPDEAQKEFEKLKGEWAPRFLQYLALNKAKVESALNEAKATYDSEISKQSAVELICLHPSDLESAHNKALKLAMGKFDEKRVKGLDVDPERERLLQELQSNLTKLQKINEQNNSSYVREASNMYTEFMNKAFGHGNCISKELLELKHKEGLAQAMEYFVSKRNSHRERDEDMYLNMLKKKIHELYMKLEANNKNANKAAIQTATYAYTNYITSVWIPQISCLHPADLKETHETGLQRALDAFDNFRSADGNIEDSARDKLVKDLRVRYNELADTNRAANSAAVEASFNEYRRFMESKCGPSLLSLLVVPWVIKVLALMPDYHERAKGEALKLFKSKRRRSNHRGNDEYLSDLESKISDAYDNFKDPIKALGRELGIPVD